MAAGFRHNCRAVAGDCAAPKEVVENSRLLWIIMEPPRLTIGSPSGLVVSSADLRMGLCSHITEVISHGPGSVSCRSRGTFGSESS
jgi:hypothetical protein